MITFNTAFAWDTILYLLKPFMALFTIAGVIYAVILSFRRLTRI